MYHTFNGHRTPDTHVESPNKRSMYYTFNGNTTPDIHMEQKRSHAYDEKTHFIPSSVSHSSSFPSNRQAHQSSIPEPYHLHPVWTSPSKLEWVKRHLSKVIALTEEEEQEMEGVIKKEIWRKKKEERMKELQCAH